MIALNETSKTAQLVYNADLEAYSPALGSGQRLSDGTFSFTAGLLTESGEPKGQVIGTGLSGEKIHMLGADMNIYRAYRMKNLYDISLDGFTRCSSRFFSDNSLYTPIVDIGGTFVDLQMVLDPTAGDLCFRVNGYQVLGDISSFNGCDTAYLTFDGLQHNLTLPDLAFGLNHYRVRMVLIQGSNGELWFKVAEAQKK